ncbi:Clp protease N-terminal domain-containing protein [Actinosynnema sp. CS-041913]|uniref:Clp protease N-terminal domain-containing protein n=1 Tax=Actinosynnema sp. CS-041913 TaxID=3239917 RepID=UPI003D8C30DE
MFERFTERAQHVTVLAKKEAELLRHHHIGTEHLLIGLLLEGSGSAARVLMSLGLSPQNCVRHTAAIRGRGRELSAGRLPFTPRAKRALEMAVRQAEALGHGRISTEHVLLGVLDEGDGGAVAVLARAGVSLDDVRERLLAVMSGFELPAPRPSARIYVSYQRPGDRHLAGRIADWLHYQLAVHEVVMDAEDTVGDSDVLVVVVSPQWTPKGPALQEVEEALLSGIDVVPVLVDGAELPSDREISADLRLADPVVLRHRTFRDDMAALAERLR